MPPLPESLRPAARLETTRCPECGELAEVQRRFVLESTEGPVEHCKVMCLGRHWFLLPTAALLSGRPPRAVTTATAR